MSKTKISWTDYVWNPVVGCSKVSAGCQNCYAEQFARRLAAMDEARRLMSKYGAVVSQGHWNGKVFCDPAKLGEPLHWRKPRRIFVNSMGDLFHEQVPDEFIDKIFAVMSLAQHHIFMLLTKRPERMLKYFSEIATNRVVKWGRFAGLPKPDCPAALERIFSARNNFRLKSGQPYDVRPLPWPLPNVWLGVTAENQQAADERIPTLLQTPAAVRFVSVEPMLGPVDLEKLLGSAYEARTVQNGWHGIDWVIAGGETGPGARPMHPDWARSLRDQCQAAGTPFYFKAWGEWSPIEVMNDPAAPHILLAYNGKQTQEYCGWGRDNPTARFAQMVRVGKKAAGRLLDGRTWDEFPEVEMA